MSEIKECVFQEFVPAGQQIGSEQIVVPATPGVLVAMGRVARSFEDIELATVDVSTSRFDPLTTLYKMVESPEEKSVFVPDYTSEEEMVLAERMFGWRNEIMPVIVSALRPREERLPYVGSFLSRLNEYVLSRKGERDSDSLRSAVVSI
jgi:hypothetical protein